MGEFKMSDEFNLRCDGNSTQNEMMRCGGDGTFSNRDYSRPHLNYASEYGKVSSQNVQIQQLKQQLEQIQMHQVEPVEKGGIAKVLKWANQSRN